MKKRTLIILAIAILVGGVGAWFAWSEYNREHAGTADVDAAWTLTASELLQAFQKDEQAANAQYADQVVMVTGVIKEIEAGDAGVVNVSLDTGDLMAAVVCEFSSMDVPHDRAVGQEVSVKGVCTGYLMDVILVRCVEMERSLP
ncbi:MAG: hypothetical protein KDB88_11820 [Flavobacteriales bacterium]|nr:hypothetical protein [Flavobacteriales bacterium]